MPYATWRVLPHCIWSVLIYAYLGQNPLITTPTNKWAFDQCSFQTKWPFFAKKKSYLSRIFRPPFAEPFCRSLSRKKKVTFAMLSRTTFEALQLSSFTKSFTRAYWSILKDWSQKLLFWGLYTKWILTDFATSGSSITFIKNLFHTTWNHCEKFPVAASGLMASATFKGLSKPKPGC